MCRLIATRYISCNHTILAKPISPCPTKLSSSTDSCTEGDYDKVSPSNYAIIDTQPTFCGPCLDRMEAMIRQQYDKLVDQAIQEGKVMSWEYMEIMHAYLGLKKAEKEEVKGLRERNRPDKNVE